MCVCLHTYTHKYMHTQKHNLFVQTYIHMHIYIHAHTIGMERNAETSTGKQTRADARTHTLMRANTLKQKQARKHKHTHTHTCGKGSGTCRSPKEVQAVCSMRAAMCGGVMYCSNLTCGSWKPCTLPRYPSSSLSRMQCCVALLSPLSAAGGRRAYEYTHDLNSTDT